jgi:archaellin
MSFTSTHYNNNNNQIANSSNENNNNKAKFEIILNKKENNLTFLDKYIERKSLVIIFKEENTFNYRVDNYRSVMLKF